MGTGQKEDFLEIPFDELKDRELGLRTTKANMFNSEMVDVACFAGFHFVQKYVVKLRNIDWRNFQLGYCANIKDVAVLQLQNAYKY